MKKIFFVICFFLIIKLVSAQGTTTTGMLSVFDSACIKFDASTGKTILKLTHGNIGSYASGPFYYYYNSPFTTWAYVKNPSAPGYFGPFICSGIYDPLVGGLGGVPINYYEVTIPGYSNQECYEVYFVTNKTWYYSDPTNSWGFTPPSSLDPTIHNTWNSPAGIMPIMSTGYPITACSCPDSDTIPSCNSNFTLDLAVHTIYSYGLTMLENFASVKLHAYNPSSTYIYEWDGIVGLSTLPSLSLGGSTPLTIGSHTVCVTEITSSGDTCITCLDFCVNEGYTRPPSGGGSSSMMKKTTKNESPLGTKSSNIEVYPNPAKGSTEIKFLLEKKESVSINITDISGRSSLQLPAKEYEQGTQKIEVNTVNIPAGLYQVQIKIGNEVTTKKLSIVK